MKRLLIERVLGFVEAVVLAALWAAGILASAYLLRAMLEDLRTYGLM